MGLAGHPFVAERADGELRVFRVDPGSGVDGDGILRSPPFGGLLVGNPRLSVCRPSGRAYRTCHRLPWAVS